MDTVQTEGAIHVAHLAGLKQRQLAAANRDQVGNRFTAAANAVQSMASGAHRMVPHLHLKRGKGRGHEVELADRADKLAEGSVLEKAVHHKHGQEVGNDEPGGPPGRGPQVEQLVEEENQGEERDR